MTREYLEDYLSDYIDLTDERCDLTQYRIEPDASYNCVILDNADVPNKYQGFVLAKSKKGEAYTICNVDFHTTTADNRFSKPKYGVRLTFRRTNKDLHDKTVNNGHFFKGLILAVAETDIVNSGK